MRLWIGVWSYEQILHQDTKKPRIFADFTDFEIRENPLDPWLVLIGLIGPEELPILLV
jgi:hypothetical protein